MFSRKSISKQGKPWWRFAIKKVQLKLKTGQGVI